MMQIYPGPCNYRPNLALTFSSTPSFSIVSRAQFQQLPGQNKNSLEMPGPEKYHPRVGEIKFNSAPKITLKGRYTEKTNGLPGPADYHVERQQARKKIRCFAKTFSKINLQPKTPGPSDYSTEVLKSGPSFSLRMKLNNSECIMY
jgi:hypothetical protein